MRATEATFLLVALLACAPKDSDVASPPEGEIELPGPEVAAAQEAAAQEASRAITEENADATLESLEALIGSEAE